MSSTTARPPASSVSDVRRSGVTWWQAALVGAGAATILNLAIWGVAVLAGASLTLLDGGEEYLIELGSVALMSAAPIVAGVALVALISQWWSGVIRLAQVVGFVFAVGTIGSVLIYRADIGTTVALTLMHLVSGVVVVLALEGLRRRGGVAHRSR
ncbi:hypothetical protein J4H86_24025 [Spiractinospora alimapuensis]|uniref:DUF6069 family protein n=1 Tax=Spiractinospora alimapuensis TaxID=2820884 RepID=UPI001F373F59|nr:DUF6069 family protein [Spiractinospora alimapuensis]QVQ51798.1 hypothetical protein J4H86_24025 [Spiractinospora alimapuensis]